MTEKPSNEALPAIHQSPEDSQEAIQPAPKRRGRRKKAFTMTTPPWPVRSLWETASEEERQKAHQMGALLLELWLGRLSRKELGEKIGIPPLRVWQLSQQALTGMVVGLLQQPKKPPRGTPLPALLPEDNPKHLKAQLLEVQRQKKVLEELVDILKDLPANREQAKPRVSASEAKGRRKGKKIRAVVSSSPAEAHRKLAGEPDVQKG
jgi:hypothetical protein